MKKNTPNVSIIISYHKYKIFFKKTIQSILKQTYQNFEIIVVFDDTDKSELNFVKDILKQNLKTKLIVNKKNIGVGLSRNKGIRLAKGKYIAFCDADDIWSKNKLLIQLEFMFKNNLINFVITIITYKLLNQLLIIYISF